MKLLGTIFLAICYCCSIIKYAEYEKEKKKVYLLSLILTIGYIIYLVWIWIIL